MSGRLARSRVVSPAAKTLRTASGAGARASPCPLPNKYAGNDADVERRRAAGQCCERRRRVKAHRSVQHRQHGRLLGRRRRRRPTTALNSANVVAGGERLRDSSTARPRGKRRRWRRQVDETTSEWCTRSARCSWAARARSSVRPGSSLALFAQAIEQREGARVPRHERLRNAVGAAAPGSGSRRWVVACRVDSERRSGASPAERCSVGSDAQSISFPARFSKPGGKPTPREEKPIARTPGRPPKHRHDRSTAPSCLACSTGRWERNHRNSGVGLQHDEEQRKRQPFAGARHRRVVVSSADAGLGDVERRLRPLRRPSAGRNPGA